MKACNLVEMQKANLRRKAEFEEQEKVKVDTPRCWHGHTTRQVGCVSCVIVFDRPAEGFDRSIFRANEGGGGGAQVSRCRFIDREDMDDYYERMIQKADDQRKEQRLNTAPYCYICHRYDCPSLRYIPELGRNGTCPKESFCRLDNKSS